MWRNPSGEAARLPRAVSARRRYMARPSPRLVDGLCQGSQVLRQARRTHTTTSLPSAALKPAFVEQRYRLRSRSRTSWASGYRCRMPS